MERHFELSHDVSLAQAPPPKRPLFGFVTSFVLVHPALFQPSSTPVGPTAPYLVRFPSFLNPYVPLQARSASWACRVPHKPTTTHPNMDQPLIPPRSASTERIDDPDQTLQPTVESPLPPQPARKRSRTASTPPGLFRLTPEQIGAIVPAFTLALADAIPQKAKANIETITAVRDAAITDFMTTHTVIKKVIGVLNAPQCGASLPPGNSHMVLSTSSSNIAETEERSRQEEPISNNTRSKTRAALGTNTDDATPARILTFTTPLKPTQGIQPFTGAPGEQFEKFLRSFNDNVALCTPPLTSDNKKNYLLAYLRDRARDMAEDFLEANANATFTQLVEHLRQESTDPCRAEIARQALRICTQAAGESVDAFCVRTHKLAYTAYGGNRSVVEDKTMESFVDGLLPDIKFHTRGRSPKTLREALAAALQYELLLQETARTNTVRPYAAIEAVLARQQLSEEPRQQTAEQRRPREQWNNQRSSRDNTQRGDSRPQYPGNYGQRESRTCFYCGIKGHLAIDCRRKAIDIERGTYQRAQNNPQSNQRQPQFQRQDPTLNHRVAPQPYGKVQAIGERMDTSERELMLQQIEALKARNEELAASAYHPSINVLSAVSKPAFWLTICALVCVASASDPLLCLPTAKETYHRLPPTIDCSPLFDLKTEDLQTRTLTLYRPNTVEYSSPGMFCRIVRTFSEYWINLVGVQHENTSNQELIVSPEECRQMSKHHKCNHGELREIDGVYKTTNDHVMEWPSAPLGAFQTKTSETFNCFYMPTEVIAHFGSTKPSTTVAIMTGCEYQEGFCNNAQGSALIWSPSVDQKCRFIRVGRFKGFQKGNIWISEDKQIALSFPNSTATITDCQRSLQLTEQGIAFKDHVMRKKRELDPEMKKMVGIVYSTQHSAQLLAAEAAAIEHSKEWFTRHFHAWCLSLNTVSAAASAAAASSPDLVIRHLLNRTDLAANYLGDGVLAVRQCHRVPPIAFKLLPFEEKCFSKPLAKVQLLGNTSVTMFLDPVTSILTSRAHELPCALTTDFEFLSDGKLSRLNPFSLERTQVEDFLPVTFTVDGLTSSDADVAPTIFSNLIMATISEDTAPRHVEDFYKALQGNPEALTRIVSHNGDPRDGPITAHKMEEILSLWERVQWLWQIGLTIWTVATNIVVTLFVAAMVISFLAQQYVAPIMQRIPTPWKKTQRPPNHIGAVVDYSEIVVVNTIAQPVPERPRFFTAHIPLKCNGVSILALVDTGASFTVTSASLCPLFGVYQLTTSPTESAVAFGGGHVEMAGMAAMSIEVAGTQYQHEVHFTKNDCIPKGPTTYNVILGNDFLRRLPRFHLDYAANRFIVGKHHIPLGHLWYSPHPRNNDDQFKVRALRTTVVPPHSEAFVRCATDLMSFVYPAVMTTQSVKEGREDLVVTPAVFDTWHPRLLVTNPTDAAITLYEKEVLGKATWYIGGAEINAVCSEKHSVASPTDQEDLQPLDPEFHVNLENNSLSDDERSALSALIERFADVFSRNAYDLGSSRTDPVHIYTNTEIPIRGRPYRVPTKFQAELEQHINGLLRSGRITESNTPWTSPLVLVKKKNGSMRVCLDFRRLNEVTIPDNFPLPRIEAILEKVGGSSYFSSLDMANGYLQLRLDASSSYKCGFTTENKVYAYTHLPFGLRSAASYFQRALKAVLGGLDDEVLVYIDDILVYSKDFDQHLASIEKVLARFREFNLKASPKKCEFAKRTISFLGHEITRNGYYPLKSNVAAIAAFPTPKNSEEVRRFVGMAGFFRKFIKDFAGIAEPLTKMSRKNVKFEWDQPQEDAYQTLKKALVEEPILGFPDYDKPFHIFTDASAVAQGAALMQTRQDDEKSYTVIAYTSRTLADTETRWPAIQVELGAIIFALRQFRPYVCMSKIVLHCDHKPLSYLLSKSKTHDNLSRWLIELQQYDVTIVHIDGKKNTVADCLSRAKDEVAPLDGVELKDIIDFPVCMTSADLEAKRLPEIAAFTPRNGRPLNLLKEQQDDAELGKVRQFLTNKTAQIEELPESWLPLIEYCSISARGLLVVSFPPANLPKTVIPTKLIELLFEAFHTNALAGGHFSWRKTLHKMQKRFFWPGMRRDTFEKCIACPKCQEKRNPNPPNREELLTVPTSRVFEKVGIDLTGPLTSTPRGNKYYANLICWFSKYVISVPLPDCRSETVARAVLNECVLKYGAMSEIITDGGSYFTSAAFKEFCDLLKLGQHVSIPHHSRGNGATERTFRTFHSIMAKYVNEKHTDWDLLLPAITFCYNTSTHSTTQETPFYLMFGRDPVFHVDRILNPEPTALKTIDAEQLRESLTTTLQEAWTTAREHAVKAQETFKANADTAVKPSDIKPGDRVLMKNYGAKTKLSRKLVMPWKGQFRVLKVNRPLATIQDIRRPTKPTRTVHLDQIKKFVEPEGPAHTTPEDETEDEQPEDTRAERKPESTTPPPSVPETPFTDVQEPPPNPQVIRRSPRLHPAPPPVIVQSPRARPPAEPANTPARYNLRPRHH
ncbi:unnamed protein product [Caenorhabditis sp. 36 PRJEB53466]|nr:unnamed protein product [Caenorhabditis sp. 36 PRJEB53466]